MSNNAPVVDRIRIIPRPDDFLDRNVGSSGEVFFNKITNSLRVYSGKDQAGFEIARADLDNVSNTDFLAKATAAGVGGGSGPGGGTSIDISDTAPASPTEGNLWYNSTNGKLFVYIDDGDTSQWVQPVSATPALPNVNTFRDITVGADTVTATGESDELTFIEGSNISLSVDTVNKTITIAAAGAAQQNLDTITTAGATTTNDIEVGAVTLGGVGGPLIDSASSLTLTAPDGVTITNALTVQGNASFEGTLGFTLGAAINEYSTDTTLAGDSDTAVPTEAAVKAYVDNSVSGFASSTNPTFSGLVTFTNTTDIANAKTGATATVVHDYTEGAVWYHSSAAGNFTPNFTNIPTTDDRAINVILVIEQGGTPYGPSSVSINGANYTPLVVGAGSLSYTANQTDVVSFTFIRTGSTWKVLASVNTYG